MLARAVSTGGIVKYAQGHFSDALIAQRLALNLYDRAGETESSTSIHQAIAEPLRAMGELREAWLHVREGLRLLPTVREARRRHSFLASCALGALRQNLPEVAVAALNEDLELLTASQLPMGTSESLLNRARAWYRLGRLDRATADLDDASRSSQLILDTFLRRRIEAELTAAQAEVLQASQPAQAIARLSESLGRYADVGTRFRQARLLLARARAELSRGGLDAARRDLREGIQVLEAQRSTITEDRLRLSHFDETWDLYGELIRLEADAGHVDAAFDAAERSRARSFTDPFEQTSSLTPAQIAALLPPDTALLSVSLAGGRALLWTMVSGGRTGFRAVPLSDESLRDDLRAFSSSDEAAFAKAARHLYAVLIEPAEPLLATSRTLVVVPDGSLYRVPFAALTRASNGRFLSQSHRLILAPSAAVYAAHPPRLRPVTDQPVALVVANPTLNDPALAPLPAAEREATTIAGLYRGRATTLTGGAATRRGFEAALQSADVLHFAGHAVVSEEFPWLSRLMLAAASGMPRGDGLFVHEIAATQLSRLQLVVLAACSTGAGAILRGEGVLSLGRPFLLSGVPFALVTAWDIEDDVAEAFFTAFHSAFVTTLDPVSSVGVAQDTMRRSENPRFRNPRAWSGYVLMTGGSRRQPSRTATLAKER